MPGHRRVEPRQIAGTGMATDPERIHAVAAEAERRGRAWRASPEVAFDLVLDRAPAKGELVEAGQQPPSSSPSSSPPSSSSPEPPADGAPVAVDPPAPDERKAVRSDAGTTRDSPRITQRISPRAPDPRERQLHAAMAARSSSSSGVSSPPSPPKPR